MSGEKILKKSVSGAKFYTAPTKEEAILKAKIELGEDIELLKEERYSKKTLLSVLGFKPEKLVKIAVRKKVKKRKKSSVKERAIVNEDRIEIIQKKRDV